MRDIKVPLLGEWYCISLKKYFQLDYMDLRLYLCYMKVYGKAWSKMWYSSLYLTSNTFIYNRILMALHTTKQQEGLCMHVYFQKCNNLFFFFF